MFLLPGHQSWDVRFDFRSWLSFVAWHPLFLVDRIKMNDLARYIEVIVEPTFEDFRRNSTSTRHAFLTCVAIYHAVDRVSYPKKPGSLALQLHISFEMCGAGFGLMGAPPQ